MDVTYDVTMQGDKKTIGPVDIPYLVMTLHKSQHADFERKTRCTAHVDVDSTGIWGGSTCTSQCRHALAIGRGLSRLIVCSTRSVCSRMYISRPIDEV